MKKKVLLLSLLLVMCFLLVSCSNVNKEQINVANKISSTIEKIEKNLNDIKDITSSDLQIDDIISDNEMSLITQFPTDALKTTRQIVNYNQSNSSTLNSYIRKIEYLHSNMSNALCSNQISNSNKTNILSKCTNMKAIIDDVKDGNITLTTKQCSSITELDSNINSYLSRLRASKNEINNIVNNIKKIKQNYTNNVETINVKYISLINSLETRNVYLNSISNCIDNIEKNILYCSTTTKDTPDIDNNMRIIYNTIETPDYKKTYIFKDGEWQVIEENSNFNDGSDTNDLEAVNSHSNPNTNTLTNPYYYDYYSYYGNGFMGRNINTYRSFKNIDSLDPNSVNRNSNVDNYKKTTTNIDSYKKANVRKNQKHLVNT